MYNLAREYEKRLRGETHGGARPEIMMKLGRWGNVFLNQLRHRARCSGRSAARCWAWHRLLRAAAEGWRATAPPIWWWLTLRWEAKRLPWTLN